MSSSLLDKSLASLAGNDRKSGGAASSQSAGSWKHDLHSQNQAEPAPYVDRQPRRSDGPGPGAGATSNRLSILNLHYEVSERELQYDKSGRSKGIANVEYEKVAHAVAAKEAFDGALAKGQQISVVFDNRVIRPGPPAPGTLLARMAPAQSTRGSKPYDAPRPRTSLDSRDTIRPAARGARSSEGTDSRGASHSSGDARGPRRVSGGGAGSSNDRFANRKANASAGGGARGGNSAASKEKKETKTSDQLDSELEAFMNAPRSDAAAKGTDAVVDVVMT